MEEHTIVVDRKTWLRGEPGVSWLRRARDNKQCCLGFMCKQLGQTDDQILQKPSPQSVEWGWQTATLKDVLKRDGAETALSRAMYFNDQNDIDEAQREWVIQQALAPIGITMVFTGSTNTRTRELESGDLS